MTAINRAPAIEASAPHYAVDLADQVLARDRTEREHDADAAARASTLAALLRSGGEVWGDRLEAELSSIAATINARIGRPWLTMRRPRPGSLSLSTAESAYILFAPGFVDVNPESRTADLRVVVQPDASAGWRTTQTYRVDLSDAGALVIDGRGPETFAEFCCTPWLKTLQLGGR